MTLISRARKKLDKTRALYVSREEGSVATMFGVSILVLLLLTGAVIDINRLYTAKSHAQNMGDNIGLMATIYVSNNDGPPSNSSEGFMNDQWYDHKERGLDFGTVADSDISVKFKVTYDDVNEQAVVSTRSVVKPMFGSMFGASEVNIETNSTIKYAKKEFSNPASVFLVMDNSGSMAFDDLPKAWANGPRPVGAKARIDGMKTSVKDFVGHLETVIAPDPDDPSIKYLRMGMTAFNSNIINSRTVRPFWGTLSNNQIDRMVADGGTVPTVALRRVRNWMRNEGRAHSRMNGSETPLKYVVLMTDGSNSNTNADRQSLQACTQMKRDGVEIFTIGYALEPGYFYTGLWGIRYRRPTYYISPSANIRAKEFLRSCASSPDHYILAENADQLKIAFDEIGKQIANEAVRISS